MIIHIWFWIISLREQSNLSHCGHSRPPFHCKSLGRHEIIWWDPMQKANAPGFCPSLPPTHCYPWHGSAFHAVTRLNCSLKSEYCWRYWQRGMKQCLGGLSRLTDILLQEISISRASRCTWCLFNSQQVATSIYCSTLGLHRAPRGHVQTLWPTSWLNPSDEMENIQS